MPGPSHRLYRADFDPVIHSDADTRHDCGYSAALRTMKRCMRDFLGYNIFRTRSGRRSRRLPVHSAAKHPTHDRVGDRSGHRRLGPARTLIG